MNILLLGFILGVLVIIMVVLIKILLYVPPMKVGEAKALEDMAFIMRMEYEAKKQEVIDKSKNNKHKPLPIQMSNGQSNKLVSKSSKQNELIPFNLSDQERKVWKEFNLMEARNPSPLGEG